MLYRLLRPIFWVLFRLTFALLGGLTVTGKKNVPSRGALIIAPNHISFSDPPLMGVALGRPAWFMATEEMFAYPVLGKLAKIMHGYPIRQDSPDRAALRFTEKLLNDKEAVVIFPEGHVSKDGKMQPVQPGPLMLALRTGTPILPVGIIGTDKMMPPHQWKLRHAKRRIVVRIGKRISPEELSGGLKGRAAIDHGVQVLTDAIAALIEEPETEQKEGSGQYQAANPLRSEGIAEYSKEK